MGTYTRWTRWAVGSAGVMGLLLMLGACGGGPPGAVAPPQPPASAAPAQPAPAAPAALPQPAPAAPQTSPVQPAPGPTTPASAALKPQFGGVLQQLSRPWPVCLYYFDNACNAGSLQFAAAPMFEGFLGYEYKEPLTDPRGVGKLAPALVESWKQVDDRTYELTLHKGVKFHDGAELTSKDVAWSLQRWGDSTSYGVLRTAASKFEKVEPTGPYGVRLTLKQASPYALTPFAVGNLVILPAHPAEQAGSPTGEALKSIYVKDPIATGPFKLRSFDPNRLEMERHEGYWQRRPYLDGIRVLRVLDDAARLAAFATGKVDFLAVNDKVQADQLARRTPDASVKGYTISVVSGLIFNLQRKPFDDFRVRRALQLAMDLQALVQTATFGEGFIPFPVMTTTMTQAGWGVQPSEYLQLPGYRQPKAADIAEAKRLLVEAGVPAGFKIVIPYRGDAPQVVAVAPAVAAQLRTALGLDVTAQALNAATYFAQAQARDFGVALETSPGGNLEAPAEGMYQYWHTKGPNNYVGLKDAELDKLIEAALKELDDSKRNELYKQVQRRLYDNAYVIKTQSLRSYILVQPWLHDSYPTHAVNSAPANSAVWWLGVDKLPADRRGGW